MRELTFAGFLKKYVRELSYCGGNNIYKQAMEAGSVNARLREPLFLYAAFSGKAGILRRAARKAGWETYCGDLWERSAEEISDALNAGAMPAEYMKVWRSYNVKKNRHEADNESKELMRQRILELQKQSGVSNYRLYSDLKLNPGNLNAWLKNGQCDKVSLATARAVLQYLTELAEMRP